MKPHVSLKVFWIWLRRLLPSLLFTLACIGGELFLDGVDLPEKTARVGAHCLHIALVLGICWMLFRSSQTGRDVLYQKYDTSAADNIRQRRLRTQIDFLYRIALIAISLTGLAAILMTFDGARRIGASLIASAGVASVVIGFAAQKSLSNFIAGFQIAFTQPMRLDDVVIVEGQYGRVEEITLTYVVVRLWDLRRMILPITYFVEKPFENWTRISSDLLGYIYLYVDYSFPVEALRAELERVVKLTPLWDKKVCGLQVTDLTDKTMQLRALVSARDASEAFDLRCYLREKLVAFIQQSHAGAFPQARAAFIQADFPALPINVGKQTTASQPNAAAQASPDPTTILS